MSAFESGYGRKNGIEERFVEGDGRWLCGGGGSFQTVVVVVSGVLEVDDGCEGDGELD